MTNLKNVRVLVTGGSGFIGLHLVERLIKEDADIYVIKRPNSILTPWTKDILKKVKVYNVDISDFEKLKHIMKKIEPKKIFHLAAFTNVNRSFTVTNEAIKNNVQGTLNLLHSLENVDFDCFINTSTCEVYGNNPVPFTENQLPNPVSPYGASKYSAEVFCQFFYNTYNFPITILRPFTSYGEYQLCKMFIPQIIVSCLLKEDLKLTEGTQTREFNYVEDIVDGYIKTSITKRAIGEIINIGCGEEHSIKETVFKIIKLVGNDTKPLFGSIDYRENEIWRLFCDNTKAKKILKWEPKYSIERGLEKTIKWYSRQIKKDKNVVKFLR